MEASEPGTGRAQDTEAEVEAAAAVGDVIPERGPAAYLAEFIGTFTLVLFVTWVVAEIARPPLSAQEIAQGASAPFVDLSVIGLVHVFVLFMLIQTLAVICGAHFNPALTVGLTLIRQIRPVDAAIYILCQLGGAVVGALITKGLLSDEGSAIHYGAPSTGGGRLDPHTTWLGFCAEGLGAFFLVFAVVGVAVSPRGLKDWSGWVIGGTLGLVVMVIGPLTGAGINPDRAFGPAPASPRPAHSGRRWSDTTSAASATSSWSTSSGRSSVRCSHRSPTSTCS